MMYGEINARREVVMDVPLIAGGTSLTVSAIVDTGFDDFLTLPSALAEELGLQPVGTVLARMADARIVPTFVYEVAVLWHGKRRKVTAQGTDGDILLGMNLLLGSLVTLEVMDGGAVTIEALE